MVAKQQNKMADSKEVEEQLPVQEENAEETKESEEKKIIEDEKEKEDEEQSNHDETKEDAELELPITVEKEMETNDEKEDDATSEEKEDEKPVEAQSEEKDVKPQEEMTMEPTEDITPPEPQKETSGEATEKGEKPQEETTVEKEEDKTTKDDTKTTESDSEASKEVIKEEKREEEELPISYDYQSLQSVPTVANLPTDTLQFVQCFGYDCQKRSNLLALDETTLVFAAGNMLVLLKIDTGQHTYLRTLGGGGIGAICVHPSRSYIAVGEKGTDPVIAIYQYPSLSLYRLLRGGTEQAYSHMDYNPDGSLLASIGGNPDYMLTVWDWKKEKIVLRSKAFSQDIYRVSFSPELPGQLTTSGTGHIRFWKMATTFTGLKLQGYLGKFGRTELTDISAYVELPDGKVLSGTEWGNLLLWDGGFIKVELSKKGKKLCHNGNVECLYLDEGELISAGVDGYIRIWDFEIIDAADITEDNPLFEMEPLTEIKVGSDVSIKSLTRSTDPDTPTIWYAQDAKGCIWKLDIVVSHTRKVPERLFKYHSGQITAIQCSPILQYAASIAEDGSVRVYNLESNKLLCHSKYSSGGHSLIWAPLSLDSTGLTLITGYDDGVLRVLSINETNTSSATSRNITAVSGYGELQLIIACKPHTQSITSLSVNKEETLLATGSLDSTVFFLNIHDKFSPVGYVKVPGPVSHVEWNHEGLLLVCCSEGSMCLVSPPVLGQVDTSHSYHLESLSVVCRKFVSIKDRLRNEEAEAKKKAEKEKKLKERQAQREARKERLRQELGDQYESEEEQEEEEEEEEEQKDEEEEKEEEEEKPTGPSPLLTSFYDFNDPSQFWISMGGYDTGYLYRYSLNGADSSNALTEANYTVPLPAFNGQDVPILTMRFNGTGQYLITGAANGCIRVHRLSDPYILTNLSEETWSLGMHDNQYGSVTALAMSYDDQYIISGGGDSNIFIYKTNLTPRSKPSPNILGSGQVLKGSEQVDDIDDPSHYSIEDAKQKAEQDRKKKAAEAKKHKVRREIVGLRRTYTGLQQRSQHLPKHLRLSQEEFIMDPSISQQLQEQLTDKLDLIRKEMAWESEKHDVALRKLKKKYKDVVECERVVVWTVQGHHWVSSFRCPAPSKHYLSLLEEVLNSEDSSTPWTSTGGRGLLRRKTRGSENIGIELLKQTRASFDEGTSGELSKSEARRLKKEKRRKEWEEFNLTKPGTDYEDPEEVDAIDKAISQLGDYKLKTSSDYVVSDQQRMSTEKKRRELLLCRSKIFETKRNYNDKLIQLRDSKLDMIDKITKLVNELKDAQRQLPKSLCKPLPSIPTIKPEEVPERSLNYTKESLLKFKKEKEKRELAEKQAQAGVGEGFGGFGGFGGEGEGGGDDEDSPVDDTSAGPSSTHSIIKDGEEDNEREDIDSSGSNYVMSDLEKLLAEENQLLLLYQQDCLIEEINNLVTEFDENLLHLRHEKILLDVTVKLSELKHLTQFEELELLKEFEKRETNFTSKYRTKKKERSDLEVKIEEVEYDVQEKEKLVASLQEQDKSLNQEFIEMVGEGNKFKEFLVKVYRKKIKRTKQKQGEEQDSDDEDKDDDEDSDSDDMSSTDEESDEEGLDDSVCPPGCDQNIFDQTIAMREKRLDLEESLTEEKKVLDTLKKERDALLKKAKSMESHVKTALQDLQAFQLKKQQRLNELDAVVLLKLHQIWHYQSQGEPPTSVGQCLVFPATARQSLAQRIGELVQEKQHEKKRYKELRLQHVRLARDRKLYDKKVAELNEKANEMMMLKFGRIVNLDALEGLTTNKLVGELEETLKGMERKYDISKHSLELKINEVKYELLSEVKQNTHKLDQLHEMTNRSRSLEDSLNQTQKNWSVDSASGSLFEPEEKARLLDIVRIQSREIEALRSEIVALSHKGGHMIPPSQPPNMLTGDGTS